MTWTGTVIANHLYNADDEFDDIIVELPPPWDSWLDIVVTGYPDGRDPESHYRGCRNAELFRQYKQQRPTRGLYDTITFYHPSFGYVRLVDKQFFPKTLGGQDVHASAI